MAVGDPLRAEHLHITVAVVGGPLKAEYLLYLSSVLEYII